MIIVILPHESGHQSAELPGELRAPVREYARGAGSGLLPYERREALVSSIRLFDSTLINETPFECAAAHPFGSARIGNAIERGPRKEC